MTGVEHHPDIATLTGGRLIVGFSVPGEAAPKGSLTFRPGRRPFNDNKRTKPWQDRVAAFARRTIAGAHRPYPVDGPVTVETLFRFPHNVTDYGTGRNWRMLRQRAPKWPYKKKATDVDKLARAVLDALQDAGVIANDVQVVHLSAAKVFSNDRAVVGVTFPGVDVTVRELPE